jgi:hypothetical protein
VLTIGLEISGCVEQCSKKFVSLVVCECLPMHKHRVVCCRCLNVFEVFEMMEKTAELFLSVDDTVSARFSGIVSGEAKGVAWINFDNT